MSKKVLSNTVFRSPIHFLAFGFGSGLSPIAPGTVGTLVAVLLFIGLQQLFLTLFVYLNIVIFVSVIGIYICGESSKRLGVHDHSGIVWDEIAGYLITMIAAPEGWQWIVIGFILFRFFDILKPWPISWCDKHLQGGTGIMLDDILAGIFSLIILQILAYFI